MATTYIFGSRFQRSPYWSLLTAFCCWKLLLSLITFATPSPAYDTSAALAILQPELINDNINAVIHTTSAQFLQAIANSLTRWDAIYFVKVAKRGYINEQEWAFGWGYAQAIVAIRKVLFYIFPGFGYPYPEIMSAVLLSNISHLASVFALYKLTIVCNKHSRRSKEVAWLASALHILSPAGLFLSAPYSESLFSFLTFTGSYLYALSKKEFGSEQHLSGNALTLLSAIVFFAASTVRSNGLLNGVFYLVDFVYAIFNFKAQISTWGFIRLFVIGISGLLVAAGLALPQYFAWNQFCTSDVHENRPWCANVPPSIYTWVQGEYWNVGLLRYWTLSNIPLFLLATPTLLVLLNSGVWGISLSKRTRKKDDWDTYMLSCLAATQLILSGMAILSYHVQVITRLSSSCAVWYWWVSVKILDESRTTTKAETKSTASEGLRSIWILRWMVMYGLIQAVLFVGFLPPA